MSKLKSILAAMLCIAVFGGAVVGCDDYASTALPHFSYGNSDRTAAYNSKLFYRNDLDITIGDPSTIYVTEGENAGWFYTTGTGGGNAFGFYKSRDFVNWEVTGDGFVPDSRHFGYESFWAPQLLYDADALWEDYNVETLEGESGKGLYFLFYSARADLDTGYTFGACYVAMALSKNPDGPYKEYRGVNGNGTVMSSATALIDIEFINPETGINLDENARPGLELYQRNRSFIDACPYVAPNGDKYLYMARNRFADTSNEVWGIKMIDWATPDYTTMTRLTTWGYTTVGGTERYNFSGATQNIDEGPYMYYDDGTYFLTFSVGATDDKFYPVAQAVGESPLGPFTKIQPEDGGLVCVPGNEWDIHASGHHSFFEVGDELFIVYHSYEILGTNGVGARAQAFDRVQVVTNEAGKKVLHTNGPTKVIQPLPEVVSGYKNIAPLAEVKASNAANSASLLNDGVISMHPAEYDEEGYRLSNFLDCIPEFEVKGKSTEITLTFSSPVIARAIMIYNSAEYTCAFNEIERIDFNYTDSLGKVGNAFIKNLKFSYDTNLVPLEYIYGEEDMEFEDEIFYTLRAGGAAIAEFDELTVNKITIKVKRAKGKSGLKISDIVVLGKTA